MLTDSVPTVPKGGSAGSSKQQQQHELVAFSSGTHHNCNGVPKPPPLPPNLVASMMHLHNIHSIPPAKMMSLQRYNDDITRSTRLTPGHQDALQHGGTRLRTPGKESGGMAGSARSTNEAIPEYTENPFHEVFPKANHAAYGVAGAKEEGSAGASHQPRENPAAAQAKATRRYSLAPANTFVRRPTLATSEVLSASRGGSAAQSPRLHKSTSKANASADFLLLDENQQLQKAAKNRGKQREAQKEKFAMLSRNHQEKHKTLLESPRALGISPLHVADVGAVSLPPVATPRNSPRVTAPLQQTRQSTSSPKKATSSIHTNSEGQQPQQGGAGMQSDLDIDWRTDNQQHQQCHNQSSPPRRGESGSGSNKPFRASTENVLGMKQGMLVTLEVDPFAPTQDYGKGSSGASPLASNHIPQTDALHELQLGQGRMYVLAERQITTAEGKVRVRQGLEISKRQQKLQKEALERKDRHGRVFQSQVQVKSDGTVLYPQPPSGRPNKIQNFEPFGLPHPAQVAAGRVNEQLLHDEDMLYEEVIRSARRIKQ